MSEESDKRHYVDKARVLVVDDNALNRSTMRVAVRSASFDAMLLDIVMPQVGGFEVLAAMQDDAALRDIPVIVTSALDDEADSVVRAIELGAEDLLPKSFDPVILRARLNAALSKNALSSGKPGSRDITRAPGWAGTAGGGLSRSLRFRSKSR